MPSEGQQSESAAEQVRRNLQSRDAWQPFAAHRTRTTGLILDQAPDLASPTLCILGAGNCNDIDLRQLLSRYECIELVDLDTQAVQAGISRQQLTVKDRLIVRCRDLSGLPNSSPKADRIAPEHLIDRLREPDPSAVHPAEVVVSTCVLTQLIDSLRRHVDETTPAFSAAVTVLRQRHLSEMLRRVVPGGKCLLVCDLVSSDSWPQLPEIPADQLSHALRTQFEAGNFFAGVHPGAIHGVLLAGEGLPCRAVDVDVKDPWIWNLGPRHYAVYAISFRRPDSATGSAFAEPAKRSLR